MRPGEVYKNLDTVRSIYEQAIQFGIDRETPVIAYGGGVVGDVAGFVAALFLSLPFIQVPTTVLSRSIVVWVARLVSILPKVRISSALSISHSGSSSIHGILARLIPAMCVPD